MADNYLERRMDAYRSERPAPFRPRVAKTRAVFVADGLCAAGTATLKRLAADPTLSLAFAGCPAAAASGCPAEASGCPAEARAITPKEAAQAACPAEAPDIAQRQRLTAQGQRLAQLTGARFYPAFDAPALARAISAARAHFAPLPLTQL